MRSGFLALLCFFAWTGTAHADRPVVLATWPNDATDTTATLHFAVNPGGEATSYVIKWSSPGGDKGELQGGDAGAGTEPVAIERKLEGLQPSRIYDYELVATNASGSRGTAVTVVTKRQVQGAAYAVTALSDNAIGDRCPAAATIDWGDGSPAETGGSFQCTPAPSGQVYFTLGAGHMYRAPGHYMIAVTYPGAPPSSLYAQIGPGLPTQAVIVDPPMPLAGETVSLNGRGRIKLPGRAFVTLAGLASVPVGTEVDVTKGYVTLTSSADAVTLSGGRFVIAQQGDVVTLRLSAPGRCKTKRKLALDGGSHFRVQTRYTTVTTRLKSRWVVQDDCAGTLIRVVSGAVTVPRKKALLTVRGGRSYRVPG